MGERTVRLCDIPDSAGKLCEGVFKAVCTLCDRDACSYHIGSDFLGATLQVSADSTHQANILGFDNTAVCGHCREALSSLSGNLTRPEIGQLAKSIMPALVQTARALLAEKKLTESKG